MGSKMFGQLNVGDQFALEYQAHNFSGDETYTKVEEENDGNGMYNCVGDQTGAKMKCHPRSPVSSLGEDDDD